MKRRIYNIVLYLFPIFLRIVSPFNKKAKLMIKGRVQWDDKLRSQSLRGKRIWFHCASLGEFEQGRPLIEAMKRDYPAYSIIVTFFSPSGYEVRKDYDSADYICYLPFDNKTSSKRFIELLKPTLAIFIKYEFWYNYLFELNSQQIPTFSASAIFRPNQQFFKKNGQFFRKMLSFFDYFFVQNDQSFKLLNDHGFKNVVISGDTRFDRVKEICARPKHIELAERFKGNDKVIVIGSSWPDDMEVLLPLINDPKSNYKFIIAPHEIEEAKIKKLCSGIKVSFELFSSAGLDTIAQSRVLIIDNIGMLSSLYQYGEVAYIGGAFGEGLHNILEAATFGKPVLFGRGKDNHKYQEAVDLVELGGAFEVVDAASTKLIIDRLMNSEDALGKASKVCADYVNSKTGATNLIMEQLKKYL